MQELNITLIQTHLAWEKPTQNRNHLDQLIESLDGPTDLILLPEMFPTAFSMDSKRLAEPMLGPSMQWMKEKAAQKKAVICGSLIIEENKDYYNRLIWMQPDGSYQHYDKRHLFRLANEHQHFKNGKKQLIVNLKGWKICPLICYDLRFPVWSRNQFSYQQEKFEKAEYDLLIYIANWPEVRIAAWEKLLFARAIENQSIVAAVNRIGKDGKGIPHSGNSMLIDAKGETLWKAEDHKEAIKSLQLDPEELNRFRNKFTPAMDADAFHINVD